MAATKERLAIGWRDVALAGLLLLVGMRGTWIAAANQGLPPPDPLAYLLVAGATGALVAWRRHPVATFAASGTATLLYLVLGNALGPILLAPAIAAYGLASLRAARVAVPWAAGLLVGVLAVVGWWLSDGPYAWLDMVVLLPGGTLWMGAPVATGAVVRIRRESEAGLRVEQARRRAYEERLELAREVHDGVGHGLAVVAMQAGVALHVLDDRPDKAREALETIRITSKQALDELRVELDALRSHDQSAGHLQRGLAALPELVGRIRSSGVDVRLTVAAEDCDPRLDIQAAAYRIVQEALTNVLRHAGPRPSAQVIVRCAEDGLLVEVNDDGPGPAEDMVEGAGLPGMRARARALGGHLAAGPRADSGFSVRAVLPADDRAPTGELP